MESFCAQLFIQSYTEFGETALDYATLVPGGGDVMRLREFKRSQFVRPLQAVVGVRDQQNRERQ